jgi:formylglycine-generating enzyme required for sulfatase activity
LVADDIKGSDNMFYAQLIDAKDSKLSGKGSYVRTGVSTSELPRVSSALAKQLEGPERRRSAPVPTRSYPAELDIEMVRVEGGTFLMGYNAASDGAKDVNMMTQHEATVANFNMGKYEVTQAQWNAVMKGTTYENIFWWGGNRNNTSTTPSVNCGSVPCDDQRPVEYINWDEITNATNGFLKRLNDMTGRTGTGKEYRLPTEEEWEYAARGCRGGQCEYLTYSGSNTLNEVSWNNTNSGNTTRPVGQKIPNRLGIYDMSGNVWEWCENCWRADYTTNVTCTATSNRVCRGGNCSDGNLGGHRVVARLNYIYTNRHLSVGFRLAMDAQ